MAKTTMNTDIIKGAGESLQKVAKDYNSLMEEIYMKINNIPKEEIWVSESDNGSVYKFIEAANVEKPSMKDISTNMNDLGNKIINFATKVASVTDDKI